MGAHLSKLFTLYRKLGQKWGGRGGGGGGALSWDYGIYVLLILSLSMKFHHVVCTSNISTNSIILLIAYQAAEKAYKLWSSNVEKKVYVFHAIWEFAQSQDCVAHSRNPEIAHYSCAILRLRNTLARSRDCATIVRNLLPRRACASRGYEIERSY